MNATAAPTVVAAQPSTNNGAVGDIAFVLASELEQLVEWWPPERLERVATLLRELVAVAPRADLLALELADASARRNGAPLDAALLQLALDDAVGVAQQCLAASLDPRLVSHIDELVANAEWAKLKALLGESAAAAAAVAALRVGGRRVATTAAVGRSHKLDERTRRLALAMTGCLLAKHRALLEADACRAVDDACTLGFAPLASAMRRALTRSFGVVDASEATLNLTRRERVVRRNERSGAERERKREREGNLVVDADEHLARQRALLGEHALFAESCTLTSRAGVEVGARRSCAQRAS